MHQLMLRVDYFLEFVNNSREYFREEVKLILTTRSDILYQERYLQIAIWEHFIKGEEDMIQLIQMIPK